MGWPKLTFYSSQPLLRQRYDLDDDGRVPADVTTSRRRSSTTSRATGLQERRMQCDSRQHQETPPALHGRHLYDARRHKVALEPAQLRPCLHAQLAHFRARLVAHLLLSRRLRALRSAGRRRLAIR